MKFNDNSSGLDLLRTRKSASAKALGEPGPTPQQLAQILDIAVRVPDHGKLTPWRFILFEGIARAKFGDVLAARWRAKNPEHGEEAIGFQRGLFTRAPTVVAVISRAAPHPKIPEWEQTLSSAAVCQNIVLAACALGLGAQWQTDWPAYDAEIARAMGLAPHERVAGFIYLGTPTAPLEERPRPDPQSLPLALGRMMAIRGVLFDKDGTLIDVTGTWVPVYREMLAELVTPEPGEIDTMMAKVGYDPATGAFRAGSILASGTTRELIGVWWPGLSGDEVTEKLRVIDVDYRGLAIKHLKPLMSLHPVLNELKTLGLKLGVGTNDTEFSARNHMVELGVSDLFDIIIGADSVIRPKPAGDMIHAFADATALEPGEIAMVGDNPHDIETARAGGAGLAIGVLSGNAAHEDIAHLADHTIASIAELPQLLRRLA